MIMLEYGGSFHWRGSVHKFGQFKKLVWGWFAVTSCPYSLNSLVTQIGDAAVTVYLEDHGTEDQIQARIQREYRS